MISEKPLLPKDINMHATSTKSPHRIVLEKTMCQEKKLGFLEGRVISSMSSGQKRAQVPSSWRLSVVDFFSRACDHIIALFYPQARQEIKARHAVADLSRACKALLTDISSSKTKTIDESKILAIEDFFKKASLFCKDQSMLETILMLHLETFTFEDIHSFSEKFSEPNFKNQFARAFAKKIEKSVFSVALIYFVSKIKTNSVNDSALFKPCLKCLSIIENRDADVIESANVYIAKSWKTLSEDNKIELMRNFLENGILFSVCESQLQGNENLSMDKKDWWICKLETSCIKNDDVHRKLLQSAESRKKFNAEAAKKNLEKEFIACIDNYLHAKNETLLSNKLPPLAKAIQNAKEYEVDVSTALTGLESKLTISPQTKLDLPPSSQLANLKAFEEIKNDLLLLFGSNADPDEDFALKLNGELTKVIENISLVVQENLSKVDVANLQTEELVKTEKFLRSNAMEYFDSSKIKGLLTSLDDELAYRAPAISRNNIYITVDGAKRSLLKNLMQKNKMDTLAAIINLTSYIDQQVSIFHSGTEQQVLDDLLSKFSVEETEQLNSPKILENVRQIVDEIGKPHRHNLERFHGIGKVLYDYLLQGAKFVSTSDEYAPDSHRSAPVSLLEPDRFDMNSYIVDFTFGFATKDSQRIMSQSPSFNLDWLESFYNMARDFEPAPDSAQEMRNWGGPFIQDFPRFHVMLNERPLKLQEYEDPLINIRSAYSALMELSSNGKGAAHGNKLQVGGVLQVVNQQIANALQPVANERKMFTIGMKHIDKRACEIAGEKLDPDASIMPFSVDPIFRISSAKDGNIEVVVLLLQEEIKDALDFSSSNLIKFSREKSSSFVEARFLVDERGMVDIDYCRSMIEGVIEKDNSLISKKTDKAKKPEVVKGNSGAPISNNKFYFFAASGSEIENLVKETGSNALLGYV